MKKSEPIDLLTLQTRVKAAVDGQLAGRFWVLAEISSIKARPGGHCYMEFSQSEGATVLAKSSAIIWAGKYAVIAPYFESVTGSALQVGMKVLAEVSVNFSQVYGFSLIVNDIDAEYTVGEKELERQKTIERLQREGLMELQKKLKLPSLPYFLAVISAPDAAGYRDFMRHLHENEYGYVFHTDLFPALMQGADSPASISEAIAAASARPYDLVLILRGGGGKIELSTYDDYSLASAIARCPIPVLTAVGHDQDFHVCDMVANSYLKTPTALADELLSYYADADALVSSLSVRLARAFQYRIATEDAKVANLLAYTANAALSRLSAAASKIDFLEMKIATSDPRAVMRRGFPLATDPGGVRIQSVSALSDGDRVSLRFQDGRALCQVINIQIDAR